MPHTDEMSVVRESYRLNVPLTETEVVNDSGIATLQLVTDMAFASVKGGAVIETVKKAEDSDDIIIRAYEPIGARTMLSVQTVFDISEAYECNLLEEEDKNIKITNNTLELSFKPFEIKTIKIKRNCK